MVTFLFSLSLSLSSFLSVQVRGADGAGHISRLLQDRGVKLDFILDEGLPVLKGAINGVDKPVAA